MNKYLLRRDEEKVKCVICNKSFVRKKKSNKKTCSERCRAKLRCKTIKERGIKE